MYKRPDSLRETGIDHVARARDVHLELPFPVFFGKRHEGGGVKHRVAPSDGFTEFVRMEKIADRMTGVDPIECPKVGSWTSQHADRNSPTGENAGKVGAHAPGSPG